MNKLSLLSTAISLGLIQTDHIMMGILLVVSTLLMATAFSSAQNKSK
jgi:hypothetical protein